MFNLAVMISGTGTNLQAILDAVSSGEIKNTKVALVISDREGAYGLERAEKQGIKNKIISKNEPEKLLGTLESHEIHGIVLAGYLSILPAGVVDVYNGKIINIHPALLPLFGGKGFYGNKVHHAVLASGVPYTGATAHVVDYGVDTGAALCRAVVPILADDTVEGLKKRVLEIEPSALIPAVKALTENKIEKMKMRPMVIIDDKDKDGVFEFARGLVSLGSALTEGDMRSI